MGNDVIFEEPEFHKVKPRQVSERDPGALVSKLLSAGVVGNVTQAKIAISLFVLVGFLTSVYFLEAALSGPDIPPRPPSEAYQAYMQERMSK